MKVLKRIITWAMLSIMMQLAGLTFLDQVVFTHSSEFEEKEIKPTKKEDVTIKVPTSAKDISTSYNGKYLKYIDGDKLMLITTKTSEIKEVQVEEGAEILFSKWMPRDNYIIIAEKIKISSKNSDVKIVAYNPRNDSITNIISDSGELCRYQTGMKIDDIVSSTSGTKYIGVSREGFNSQIYRVDINDNLRTLPLKIPNIGTIKVFPHKDELIYEDNLNKIFYSYTNSKNSKLNINNASSMSLLSLDENDNMYLGEIEGDKISRITYGTLDTAMDSWSSVVLEKPKNPKDIYITTKGDIFVNDNLTGKITNAHNGETITYEGMFVEMTDRVIITSSDGTIFMKSITDIDSK